MKILKFYSPTCGPCKVLEKNLKEANVEYTNINVLEDTMVDEDGEEIDIVEHYNIRSIPVLIKIDSDGVEIDRAVGILSVEQIKEFCNG